MATEVYLNKLVEMAKAGLEPDHVKQLIGSARGHAGGKASGAARKMAKCDHEFGDSGTCEKCGMAKPKSMSEFLGAAQARLFFEVQPDGLTEWLQVVPPPGVHKHPKYGSVAVSDDSLNRYVENFKKRVYQEHIPIDAEHQTKLSGALGYYREMKVGHNGEQGVFARIEPTERGKALIEQGGFKYFSPEFYDEWTDPATGKTYNDVITGGAFTTRPFFKDKSLKPIVMSEFSDETPDALAEMLDAGFSEEQIFSAYETAQNLLRATSEPQPNIQNENGAGTGKFTEATVTDKKNEKPDGEDKDDANKSSADKGGEPTAASEEKVRQMSEQLAVKDAENKQFAEQMKSMAERIAVMEAQDRRRKFTEVVTGRGGSNDGGPQWFGEPDYHVDMLEKLTKAFGEDSEELQKYCEQQNTVAKAMSESAAFKPIGSSSPVPSSALGKMEAAIKRFSEADPALSREQALAKAAAADPSLYAEYDREFSSNKPQGTNPGQTR